MSVARPETANGHPVFDKVGVVHKDDWAKAARLLSSELLRLRELEGEDSNREIGTE